MLASVTTLCWADCDGETGAVMTLTLTMGDIRSPGGVAICVCLIVGLKYLPTFIFPFYFSERWSDESSVLAAVLPMRSDIKILIAALAGG